MGTFKPKNFTTWFLIESWDKASGDKIITNA